MGSARSTDRDGVHGADSAEGIPWGGGRLIVGTGAEGGLPIVPELYAEAAGRLPARRPRRMATAR